MYRTNADIPPDVKDRFPSAHCQDIWRQTWNDTMERHGDEGRAFATAEIAGQNCVAAGKSADIGDELPLERAVKFVGPDTIEGPVFLFGYRDTDGEKFEADTDYCLDWYGKSGRPTLYEHGLDTAMKADVIGRQTEYDIRDAGIWQQSQLDRHARYRKQVDGLIEQGILGYSAGAMAHLGRKSRDGTITRFPWVETSLTPTPAAPGNLGIHYVKSADFLARLEEDAPPALKAALTALDEWATSNDDDSLPDGLKFADLIDRLSVDGPAWVQARRDWYVKSGRVLSAATRDRIAAHPSALRQLADDLDELLASADAPKEGKSADLTSLLLDYERTVARLSGVTIEGVPVQ